MTYAGLRGAIALCLSLMVAKNEVFDQRFRELTLFYTSVLIVVTIFFNGLSMKYLMRKIGFQKRTDF